MKNFLENTEQVFKELDRIEQEGTNIKLGSVRFQSLICQVHDFKSGLGFLGFHNAMDICHDFETFLIQCRDFIVLEEFEVKYRELRSAFQQELDVVKAYLGEEWIRSIDLITLPSTRILEIESLVKKKYPRDTHLIQEIMSLHSDTIGNLFSYFNQIAQDIALKLGKKIFPVEIHGENISVNKKLFSSLTGLFIHVIRNIVYHGIEDPDERIKKGKSPKGKILVKIKENHVDYQICVSDDGMGINIQKVKIMALERGFLKEDESSEKEILDCLFKPEISTVDNVDEISGRGFGLSSVEKEVKKIGGKITIKTKKDMGTSFLFYLPKDNMINGISTKNKKNNRQGFLKDRL